MSDLRPKMEKMALSTARAAGSKLGSYIGMPNTGASVAEKLATRLMKLKGSGDYMLSDTPVVNTLFPGKSGDFPSGSAAASFGNTSTSTRIRHREYIEDVFTSTTGTFSISPYSVQPGLSATFQYLAQIAANFEEYIFHGLVFEFVSTTSPYNTNSAMGSVIMAMQYDAALPPFTSKPQMENSDFAVSSRPDKCIMYGVECANQQSNALYVRNGSNATNQPINLTDIGTLYVAVQNAGIASGLALGELWVTYDIELRRPHISPSRFGMYRISASRTAATSTLALLTSGTTLASKVQYGSLTGSYTYLDAPSSVTASTGVVYFPNANLGDIYQVTINVSFGTLTSVSTPLGFSTNGFAASNLLWSGSGIPNNSYITATASSIAGSSVQYIIIQDLVVSSIVSVPTITITNGAIGVAQIYAYDIQIIDLGNGITL
jgi:hypothetical protein